MRSHVVFLGSVHLLRLADKSFIAITVREMFANSTKKLFWPCEIFMALSQNSIDETYNLLKKIVSFTRFCRVLKWSSTKKIWIEIQGYLVCIRIKFKLLYIWNVNFYFESVLITSSNQSAKPKSMQLLWWQLILDCKNRINDRSIYRKLTIVLWLLPNNHLHAFKV